MADLSILLITAGREAMLPAALAAARSQRAVEAEIVVIDNRADRSQPLGVPEADAVVRPPAGASYAEAYNHALAHGTAKAVLTLNDDCFLEPGYAAAALAEIGGRVGAVQGKLLRAAGPAEPLRPAQIDSVGIALRRSHRVALLGHGEPAERYAAPGPVFGPDGAAAVYARELLDEVAPDGVVLDPDMASYGTDADLAWRARRMGWHAVYAPEAVAYHVRSYSPSTRAGLDPAVRRLQFRNRYLMMLKNETAGTVARHLPWIVGFELGALGHALVRERSLLPAYRQAAGLAGRMRARRVPGLASAAELAPALSLMGPSR
ncbi:MAG: glycosyltransferase family 2 protein [Solirubrobacterales bacterium]